MDAFAQIRFECLQQAIHVAEASQAIRDVDLLALAACFADFVIHGKVSPATDDPAGAK